MRIQIVKFIMLIVSLIIFFTIMAFNIGYETELLEKKASCLLFVIAIFFTALFTYIQYFQNNNIKGANKFFRCLLFSLTFSLGMLGLGLMYEFFGTVEEATISSSTIETAWWALFSPTPKNRVVLVLAFVLLLTDWHIIYKNLNNILDWKPEINKNSMFRRVMAARKHPVVMEDLGVFMSLLLAGCLVYGLSLQLNLSDRFIAAFNTGILCFHLFLGTMLFEGIELIEQIDTQNNLERK